MWASGIVVCVVGCGFTVPASSTTVDGAIDQVDAPQEAFDAGPDGPPIAIQFVQGDGTLPGDTDTIVFDYPMPQLAGDLDLIAVNWAHAGAGVRVGSVTASAGNAFTPVAPMVIQGDQMLALFYATNIAAGANTVTVAFSGGKGGDPELKVAEYSGIDNARPIDQVAANTAPNGTSADSGPLTTTHWHDVLIAAITTMSSVSGHDAAYIPDVQIGGDLIERREVTTLGTYHATAPLNGNQYWLAELIAFRAAQ